MGAGSFAAGTTKAGMDAPARLTALAPMTNVADYDPTNRVIPLNTATLASDGSAPVKTAHWVDVSVGMRLTVYLGSLPADPTIGVDKVRLQTAATSDARTALRIVTSVVRDALKDLIAQSAVAIVGVTIVTPLQPGRLQFRVKYKNLLLPDDTEPKTFTSAGSIF